MSPSAHLGAPVTKMTTLNPFAVASRTAWSNEPHPYPGSAGSLGSTNANGLPGAMLDQIAEKTRMPAPASADLSNQRSRTPGSGSKYGPPKASKPSSSGRSAEALGAWLSTASVVATMSRTESKAIRRIRCVHTWPIGQS